MRRKRFLAISALVAAALLSPPGTPPCAAQTLPADTDSYNDAIASMKVITLFTDVMNDECGARVPALRQRFSTATAAWKRRDARAIKRAGDYWDALSQGDPNGAAAFAAQVRAKALATLDQLSRTSDGGKLPTVRSYCAGYFEQLAAWRQLTPRLHRVLEEKL